MNKHPFIPAVRDLAEKLPELQAIRRITVRKEKRRRDAYPDSPGTIARDSV